MTTIHNAITYSLKTFKLVIAVDIGTKVIFLNPKILESLTIDDIAKAVSASDLSDEEIVNAIKTIDIARQAPFSENKNQ